MYMHDTHALAWKSKKYESSCALISIDNAQVFSDSSYYSR